MSLRLGYADPPYPGMSGFYRDHPDYGGEVDHRELVQRLDRDYDGWCLHTASTTLAEVLALSPAGIRIAAWVKPFASFKPNVPVAYAWEPVLFKPARLQTESVEYTKPLGIVGRDWLAESITMRRGLTGAKPDRVCFWLFALMGARPDDHLDDIFPGTGAVGRAWAKWLAGGLSAPPSQITIW